MSKLRKARWLRCARGPQVLRLATSRVSRCSVVHQVPAELISCKSTAAARPAGRVVMQLQSLESLHPDSEGARGPCSVRTRQCSSTQCSELDLRHTGHTVRAVCPVGRSASGWFKSRRDLNHPDALRPCCLPQSDTWSARRLTDWRLTDRRLTRSRSGG